MATWSGQIGTGTNDGYRDDSTSFSNTDDGGAYFGDYTHYYRFTPVAVAQGSTVSAATLTLTTLGMGGNDTLATANWSCDAADNSAAISDNTFTSRTRTAAVSRTLAGSATPAARTVDVTAPVQAVINRAGWASGNALTVIAAVTDGGFPATIAQTYETGPSVAAQLSITYTTAGGGAAPPKSPVVRSQAVHRSTRW